MDREPDIVQRAPDELDIVSVGTFGELLASADETDVVHVECSSVTFIDSSGLRELVLARNRQRLAGGDLVLVATTANVRRVLDVAGLAELVHPSERDPNPSAR